jgi:hypothetical protein
MPSTFKTNVSVGSGGREEGDCRPFFCCSDKKFFSSDVSWVLSSISVAAAKVLHCLKPGGRNEEEPPSESGRKGEEGWAAMGLGKQRQVGEVLSIIDVVIL